MGFLMCIFMAFFLVYHFTGGAFNTDEVFGPPDQLPLARYEEVEVNVLYRYGDDRHYLGKVIGVTACRDLAYAQAERQNFPEGTTWSYACCTEEGISECDRILK
ncbi:MAG TPA: hypothetical protein PKW15_03620 [Alphaproteobacteria bacterium]|nr:hypothetical protein [Rhodospirillaceae bacterium]HRJ12315.1 hypothetical protein [Alphaproteobacteria bacterium]